MKSKSSFLCMALIFLVFVNYSFAQQPQNIKHVVVALEEGCFHGWPANNGIWNWGEEILVGFVQGEYLVKKSHNIGPKHINKLARSFDGGETWEIYDPDNYVGKNNEKTSLTKPINFKKPGFAMRIFGDKYHGTADPEAGFFYSYNMGKTWNGPYYLGDIAKHNEINGKILTPRTDYLVLSKQECVVFISARVPNTGMSDKIACISTRNGGITFEFVSWIVPLVDPHRAVMPQTVQISKDEFVSAIRRRKVKRSPGWIDACGSEDGGKTWSFYSRVGEAGRSNGNPPAMIKLKDGRLCCIYGNRSKKQMLGKYSNDSGKTWNGEFVIRNGYHSGHNDRDFGYPRIVQREDGRLIAVYYWASQENPFQHITASIWAP
jgi:hypothetical protein